MKKMYKIAILFFAFLLCIFHSFSQDITADTMLANKYFEKAVVFLKQEKYDSLIYYLQDAESLFIKHLDSNNAKLADCFYLHGIWAYETENNNASLAYFNKSLNLYKLEKNEQTEKISAIYNRLANLYFKLNNYNLAIAYHNKNLKVLSEKNTDFEGIAMYYNNIGLVYYEIGEIDLALTNYFIALRLFKDLYGEKHYYVAYMHNIISRVYKKKLEFEKALEYNYKSLNTLTELFGKKSNQVASVYNSIGSVYSSMNNYLSARKNYQEGLEICIELMGEENSFVANLYNNIGIICKKEKNYDLALKNYMKSTYIFQKIHGDSSLFLADVYGNLGILQQTQANYDQSLFYFSKSLNIYKSIFGNKSSDIARIYNYFGSLYIKNSHQQEALKNFQKAVSSCLRLFNDTININSIPEIKDYLEWNELLNALQSKAQIFANDTIGLKDFIGPLGMKERYKIALRHYQACDTLINQVRKEITMLSDKIALGEKVNLVYNEAVEVCIKLSKVAPKDSIEYYKKLAFEYSEKNKSSVLLESLAGAQAMQFSGIPDSLLGREHDLQIDIALYKRLLSEQPDSAQEANFRDRLFKANRNYEELIQQFEKNYTQYYNLKYGQNLANVSQLQQTLDKSTAIISYQETDSVLFIFYIEKNNYQIYTTPKRSNYQEIINVFRQSLVNTAPNNSGLSKAAHFFYKQLFPFTIESHIQNLIIIPEGSMCLIPFEALLTEEYKGNPEQYSDYAYLLKKYNISYAYSASLFCRTFPKTPTKKVEVTQLNDWLAIAPVFDDVKTGGASFRTRQLLRDMEKIKTDTITTRAFMLTGEYITPLPGTEQEVKNIFNKFEGANKKALVQLNANANETFVKSEEIKNYKYLHFASHGIVNMQKPELSGVILAQDSASGEDGILYSGEIYNLKLNADLTVLSACETGLGEIKKGEGLIGLTRALLYAGSKNIIVSLWKVADNSTSQLMVDFYDVLLKDEKNTTNYSSALRQAKLKMIAEGKYSHPFYWSPFILIGK